MEASQIFELLEEYSGGMIRLTAYDDWLIFEGEAHYNDDHLVAPLKLVVYD